MAFTGMTSPPADPVENGKFDVSEADLDIASRGLKAMGHPLRLKILCILAGAKEVSVQVSMFCGESLCKLDSETLLP